jgi:hypothetical protein
MASENQRKSPESNEGAGRGGKRKGAGRPKGAATKKTREIAMRAAEEGITPLEFMLKIMRSEPAESIEDPRLLHDILAMRFEAAKAAAPYIHPRLASVEMAGPNQGPIPVAQTTVTPDQLAEAVRSVRGEF